jgi:hypothetical protein
VKSETRIQEEVELKRRFRNQGVELDSLNDLDRRKEFEQEVLEVLTKSIQDFSSFSLKEELVFYLAKGGKYPELYLEELQKAAIVCSPGSECESYAWALAERLRTTALPKHYDAIVRLLGDKD